MSKKIKYCCLQCKVIFYDYICQKRKYCSMKCYASALRDKPDKRRKRGKPKTKHACLFCEKIFVDYLSDHRKYCSPECCYLHRRQIYQGEKSHFWLGGKTSKHQLIRTSAKYYEWRKQVFERDNYICQECYNKGVYLHAHHIKQFAHNPALRFDVNNGITLCHKCHSKKHKHKIKKKIA